MHLTTKMSALTEKAYGLHYLTFGAFLARKFGNEAFNGINLPTNQAVIIIRNHGGMIAYKEYLDSLNNRLFGREPWRELRLSVGGVTTKQIAINTFTFGNAAPMNIVMSRMMDGTLTDTTLIIIHGVYVGTVLPLVDRFATDEKVMSTRGVFGSHLTAYVTPTLHFDDILTDLRNYGWGINVDDSYLSRSTDVFLFDGSSETRYIRRTRRAVRTPYKYFLTDGYTMIKVHDDVGYIDYYQGVRNDDDYHSKYPTDGTLIPGFKGIDFNKDPLITFNDIKEET